MERVDNSGDCSNIGVQLLLGNDQRRRNFEHHEIVAADLRKYPVIDKKTANHHLAEHARMDRLEGLECELETKLTRLLEDDAVHQAKPAHLAHHLVRSQGILQSRAQILAHGVGALDQVLTVEYFERGQAGAHGEAVLAVRGGVDDGAAQRTIDRIVDILGHHYRGHWDKTARERLGENNHVRRHAVVLRGEKAASASNAGLNLVEHEEGSMLAAEGLDLGEISGVGQDHAGLTLDGLKHDGANAFLGEDLGERGRVVERNLECVREHGAKALAPERAAHQRKRAAGESLQCAALLHDAVAAS